MAYEVVMPYHLHMPSYFLETFTEYPYFIIMSSVKNLNIFIDSLRILCCAQNDRVKNNVIYFWVVSYCLYKINCT